MMSEMKLSCVDFGLPSLCSLFWDVRQCRLVVFDCLSLEDRTERSVAANNFQEERRSKSIFISN